MPIDLRSDTVTRPTDEMRRAMATARVGDDVYGEDPTVRELEEMGAHMLGKEAALFMASGTMGNQVAILSHTNRGDEIVVDSNAHIFIYEAGAPAVLSGVQVRTIDGLRGYMTPAQIKSVYRGHDIHAPVSRLFCLENTHNRAGGTVVAPAQVREMAETAHELGMQVHLDGARIFNASMALGVPASELAGPCDSVMFCLSKGLAAPVGSLLAGTRSFVERARKYRKMLGGGMRQVGVLAAAGKVALTEMVGRLADDHQNARLLAEGLAALPGLHIDLATVQTNIVVVDVGQTGMTPDRFTAALEEKGVLAVTFGSSHVRMVTHKDVSREDVAATVEIVGAMLGQNRH